MDNPENKTVRVHMLMSPTEAEAIDDWGFGHRIRTRAEAIRRLCSMALTVETISPKSMLDLVYELDTVVHEMGRAIESLGEQVPADVDEIIDARLRLAKLLDCGARTKELLAKFAEARGNAPVAGKLRTGMSDRLEKTAQPDL